MLLIVLASSVAARAGAGTPTVTGPGSFYVGFLPDTALVQQSGTWVHINLDTTIHNICSVMTDSRGNPLFCSDIIGPGGIAMVRGTERIVSGQSYEFICSAHPATMRGVVFGLPPT